MFVFPSAFWTAPAERSDDGAFGRQDVLIISNSPEEKCGAVLTLQPEFRNGMAAKERKERKERVKE